MHNEKFLKVLARQYPTERSVISEIVNLQAILSLPKGTEHFLTDIHGEFQQFSHVLRNGSGSIKTKIEEVFGNTETASTKRALATLIYYPKEKLEIVRQTEKGEDLNDWYTVTLHRLVAMLRRVSSKYTRSKVRKIMPEDFAYVIEELITGVNHVVDETVKGILRPFVKAAMRLRIYKTARLVLRSILEDRNDIGTKDEVIINDHTAIIDF